MLEFTRPPAQVADAAAVGAASLKHDLGAALGGVARSASPSATLAELIKRAPALSFMLSGTVMPKAL
jgi:hypothetical protein